MYSQVESALLIKLVVRDSENICSAVNFFASTDVLNSIEVKVLPRTLSTEHFTRDTATCCYILTTMQQAMRLRLGPFMLSFKKYFDPGRRSSIEFHEMKPPLHASLRPFRKAPIGRIRGATRRDRVVRNTCHRRKFRSCVVYSVRRSYILFNTSYRLYTFRR